MAVIITLEYSAEGPPPSVVDRVLREAGLSGSGAHYILDVPKEEVGEALDRVHAALRGTGVRFRVSPEDAGIGHEAARSDAADDAVDPRKGSDGAERREASMEEIAILLRTTGGRTFEEILDSFDMDETFLEEVLDEMIDRGLISAHQGDYDVTYQCSGPMLRAVCR
ncbi:MAG: hypothetical protein ISF22_11290 [Methanomassiliicoccus sp.]|nr:hypothetical protein [Methanomassiliicoccus sp.]